jgi:hypothetical protein
VSHIVQNFGVVGGAAIRGSPDVSLQGGQLWTGVAACR